MRILVTGPTGRTGSHVIKALRRSAPHHAITGFCRFPESRARSIEVIPGNGDTGARLAHAIEVIPGNGDTGARLARSIEVIPGNGDTGARHARSIEVIPGSGDTAGARTRRQQAGPIDLRCGDLENPADRALAVEDVDAVIHYGPAFHPREAAMGTGMIDAAAAAGVKRFVYVSALHAQAGGVPGNAAKLEVEGYLAGSDLDWTILRPQSFMQNIDVAAVLEAGILELPFPLGQRQGHVDLADLAEVVAKIVTEDGHALATYDIASDEMLSTAEIAALIATVSGAPIASGELPEARIGAALDAAGPAYAYVGEALGRLNAWRARQGGRGNANALRWLLGRDPARFEDYVRRSLLTEPAAPRQDMGLERTAIRPRSVPDR